MTINNLYWNKAKHIFSNITEALEQDSNRLFTFDAVGFLEMWQHEASFEETERFRKLIENGQIEVVGGGWS